MSFVPVLVGLTVPAARAVYADIRIVPISRTPDGPGLAAQTWPGRWVVTVQDPEPGVEVAPGDTVIIDFIEDGPANADVMARLLPPKPRSTGLLWWGGFFECDLISLAVGRVERPALLPGMFRVSSCRSAGWSGGRGSWWAAGRRE